VVTQRPAPARVAMWSGPRTVSTALMRSFGNRPDTVVVDEPLYAVYLANTAVDHPGRDEIIASMPTDWREVLAGLADSPLPAGKSVYYQKHMTHHLLAEIDRAAFAGLTHAFLIRDPRRLLASYARVRSTPVLADLGLAQQAEIFRTFGGPVIDSADILRDPRAALEALCDALGIGFDPAMLSWPPGPRATDGVWARYWYDSVRRSTRFAPYAEPAGDDLPVELEGLAAQCRPFYEELAAHRLRP
jgi:Sulfotransferase domain